MLQGLWSVLCDVVSLLLSLHLNMNAAFCMGRMPPLHFKGSLGPFKGGEGGDWDLHCFTAMHGQHALGPRHVQMCSRMALVWNAEIWCSGELNKLKVHMIFQSFRIKCLPVAWVLRAWICHTKVQNISMHWTSVQHCVRMQMSWIIDHHCNDVCF